MDMKALFIQSNRLFGGLVETIKEVQWDKPSPSTPGWTVRQLVEHIADDDRWVPAMLAGKRVTDITMEGEALDGDPQHRWAEAAKTAETAVNELKNLEDTVHLSYTDTTVRDYLGQMTIDRVIHGWDLAFALGVDYKVDDGLAAAVFKVFEPQAEEWRAANLLGPEVHLTASATPLDRLIALSGRDPR